MRLSGARSWFPLQGGFPFSGGAAPGQLCWLSTGFLRLWCIAQSLRGNSGLNGCTGAKSPLFPVKLGPTRQSVPGRSGPHSPRYAAALLALAVSIGWGCGYRPAYGGPRPLGRLAVVAAPGHEPEAGAVAAILGGLRGELSRAGVLHPGAGFPRVVVELVRIDEQGSGARLPTEADMNRGVPMVRANSVGVTARAWIEQSEGRVSRDTGDVRRSTGYAYRADASLDAMSREAGLQAAAERVGRALGRRILGEVEPGQELM